MQIRAIGLIGKAAIPEKYYNPDAPDYNPFPAKIYAYASGKILTEINSNDQYRLSRQEFALVCGAWNGLVGTIEAVPAGISMLTKLQGSALDVIINHEGARDKLIKTLGNINKEQINKLFATIGDEIDKGYDKYTSNPCMVSYASGQAVFVVASLFIGAGEANVAKTFLQTLEKLDVAGQMMGKVFKIGGKLIKPILNATSKGITLTLEKGVQLFRQVEIKLPNNLYCGIPIPNIKIRSTAAEIEQQLANTVEDANGNKLVEVVLENGERAPAIVGTEEGFAKIGKKLTGKITKLGEKLNVSDYAISAKNSIKDLMTPDHIPSFASLRKNLEDKLNRELTPSEAIKLRNEGTSLLYETSLHQQFSRTYGGRNTASQIAKDAENLFEAVQRDVEALRKPLLESGMSEQDIEKAFELIHETNRKKGLY